MANRALARKKRCNIIPISPNALATSDVISPPRFAVRMSQIPWGTSKAPTNRALGRKVRRKLHQRP